MGVILGWIGDHVICPYFGQSSSNLWMLAMLILVDVLNHTVC